jgi:hypothetical protein
MTALLCVLVGHEYRDGRAGCRRPGCERSGADAVDDGTSWRCGDCRCVNAPWEAFCYRCGAGQPEPMEDAEAER